MPCLGSFFKERLKFYKRYGIKLLDLFFSIKRPASFSQLRYNTNILLLEEPRKEIQRQLFFKSFSHSVDPNFIVPLKPEAEKMKDFIQTRQGAFYRPFIKSKQHFYSFWPRAFRDFGDGF